MTSSNQGVPITVYVCKKVILTAVYNQVKYKSYKRSAQAKTHMQVPVCCIQTSLPILGCVRIVYSNLMITTLLPAVNKLDATEFIVRNFYPQARCKLVLTTFFHLLPCQLSLREETGVPGSYSRLSTEP